MFLLKVKLKSSIGLNFMKNGITEEGRINDFFPFLLFWPSELVFFFCLCFA